MSEIKTSVTERKFDEIQSRLKPLSEVSLEDARRVAIWWSEHRKELIHYFDAYIARKTFGAFLMGAIVAFLLMFLRSMI